MSERVESDPGGKGYSHARLMVESAYRTFHNVREGPVHLWGDPYGWTPLCVQMFTKVIWKRAGETDK